jgi:Tol biopolymer transport system component
VAHPPGVTERISVNSQGTAGNNPSQDPAVSGDGRFVAFTSLADNLVPSDLNGVNDVFVRDRQTGTTERVSVSSTGEQGSFSGGVDPSISADGRFVAFATTADFAPADTNFRTDVYVHDRQTGTTELVSVNNQGTVGNNVSEEPSISADGRFVAFASSSVNLAAGDTDNATDVFVRDRLAGTTEALTVTPNSPPGPDSASGSPSISADGRFVALWSRQSDLVPGDANGFDGDVYVADRQTGTIERVSVSGQGTQGNLDSSQPSISADGRFVAFTSDADNLVPADRNSDLDVFVRDRAAGTTVRASVSSAGKEGGRGEGSLNPAISADGQVIGFQSEGDKLAPGRAPATEDVYVHDESP